MHTTRFIGVILAFIGAIITSYLSGVELFKVCALASFVLVVDSLIVRYLANLYLQEVYKNMEDSYKRDDNANTK